MPQKVRKCTFCQLEWKMDDVGGILTCKEGQEKCKFHNFKTKTINNAIGKKNLPKGIFFKVATFILILPIIFGSIQIMDLNNENDYLRYRVNEEISTNKASSEGIKELEKLKNENSTLLKRITILQREKKALKKQLESNTKQKIQSKSDPEQLVIDFLDYLGERKFHQAYNLLSSDFKGWGNYNQFSSKKYFGGITQTKVFSTNLTSSSSRQAEVFVHYLSVDPTNDRNIKKFKGKSFICNQTGIKYKQSFNLEKQSNQWKINGAKTEDLTCSQ